MNQLPPRRSDGTIQKRRVPQPWPKDRPFRILSIDGGGICGILPASVLAELERRYLNEQSIASYFDLIAGTSTGGIIALGLSLGIPAKAIRDLYLDKGGNIFPPASKICRLYRLLVQGYRYVYEREPLERELRRVFGNTTLADAKTRLCIPAFEGKYGEPWIYKTPHHPDYKLDRNASMVTVGLATAAAPTFFQALPNEGYMMIDGGLWANNPIMNGLVDALSCFELDRNKVQILSLGCCETAFTVSSAKAKGGFLHWYNAIRAAMRAQSRNALGQTYLLIGKDRVLRLDAPETTNPIPMDDHRRASRELPHMARSLVEASGTQVERCFLRQRAEIYVPTIVG